MRDQEFRARDKKVQKMTRDGLMEKNLTQGTVQNISSRITDADFDRTRPAEGEDIRRPAVRGADTGKKRKQRRPVPEGEEGQEKTQPASEYPADGTAVPLPDAQACMRGAPDLPLLDAPAAEKDTPAPEGKRFRKRGKKGKRKRGTKFAGRASRQERGKSDSMRGVDAKHSPRTVPGGGRLRFEADGDAAEEHEETADRQRSRQHPFRQGDPRLKFEDSPKDTGTGDAAADVPGRWQKQYEKAMRRSERADQRVEQAQRDLPSRRRLYMERQFDEASGAMKRRLCFEKEILPEAHSPALSFRAASAAKTSALFRLHGKLREYERDNVALESVHKSELAAEQGAGRALRWARNRRHAKPYRALHKAQQKAAREHARLEWQSALRDNRELQRKNALAKWVQKQKIKRKYAQTAHEARKDATFTRDVLTATGKIARATAQNAAAHKAVFLAAAMLALVVMFLAAGLTSCTAMLSGFQSSYIAASYMADEQEICESDLYYTEKETDLQIDINKTEENYPGYDEYRYHIGEISHNPYELLGYLSTVFNAFTFAEVRPEIDRIFAEQYTLTREVIVETRYDSNGNPYDWYVLQTTLTVRPLSAVVQGHLTSGEQPDRYGVYMQTYGNRQAFGNPFGFPWLGHVSSGYGWRVHPINGTKSLHRGIDLAVAQGTPILAVQDGRVVSAGSAGSYGLCVVIKDGKGYQSRYAHCASLNVSTGQEVKRGDVVAAVGSTGSSTGPHLHLEVLLNGAYLNPYFFVDNGSDGSGALPGAPGGPAIPGYSGEPMGDGSFGAMLHEAEKFLGWPYVWGGSSPSTSFDCSGYVSWVINQSGVGSVGRQTAQGLYNLCTPVSAADAKPGDLIFFTGTYSSPGPVSHVGIYVGGGRFIHCGDPISYADAGSPYWSAHLYGYGRLP